MSSKRPPEGGEEAGSLKQTKLHFGQRPPKRPKSDNHTKEEIHRPKSPSSTTSRSDAGDLTTDKPSPQDASTTTGAKFIRTTGSFTITEITGDIFDAPSNAIIIHACNCYGSWGAGIAAAFKKTYPNAYTNHHKFCQNNSKDSLIKSAQLIPPCEKDASKPKHYVGCLFTSKRFGKARDSPAEILRATGPAMQDLLDQVKKLVEKGGKVSEIRMCRINSGLFGVEWEKTREVLEGLEGDWGAVPREIKVYERPG